ncbi:MAG: Ig-like domain-containing protein, partial [Bifidobacteriaceae bacterium]|nr:Ig-like domain-containing protein [Bifidobacteriaceae bacterium]
MNRTLRTVCALAGALALTTAAIPAASATPTTKTVSSVGLPQAPNPLDGTGDRSADFNTDWVFALGNPAGAWAEAFDDTHWRQVRLPHDWSIHLDFNTRSASGNTAGWLDGGTGWYRKAFTLANSAGKQVSVDFDGVYALATVYVNGVQIGQQHYYGYTAFSRDITSALHAPGEVNVIAVKVENPMPGSRWYSGSGIYRDVKLTVTDPVHIDRDGVYVTTPTLEADVATASPSAQVSVQTRLVGLASAGDAAVTTEVVDASGATVAQGVATPGSMADRYTHSQTIAVPNPHLWSIENPYLYTVVSTVRVAGQVVDRVETRTGLRYTTFDSNLGFFLNGQYMKLKGVCMHHDLGPLGSAVNYRATERQLQIMKAMGVNSIRTSHNPASSALIEIADRIGLTVMEEAFDMWQLQKTSQDYHLYFNANAESDIKAMVERDKNSPSVIIWSIGNEIPKNSTQSPAIAQNLVNWIKSVDTTRPTTMGENNKSDTTARNILNNVVDIAGLNYPSSGEYSTYHGSNQNGLVIGSETSSAIRTRGYYESPGSELVGDANWTTMQCSSYDNHRVSWGHTASSAWKTDRDQRYILGQYIWTGFDYIGEPTPYGQGAGDYTETAKSSYFGAVDTAGFPKDTYYLYQSQWLDVEDQPMVHLLPHWNWAPGEVVQVWAYSNARSVELFLNGVSLGTQTFSVKQNAAGQSYQEMANGDLYAKWNVPFAPGELKAVARDAGGEIIATDIIETADPAAGLKLTPDRRIIDPDGSDLSFITVDVVDGQGRFVPTADDQITFEVTGGEIAGVDNGNPISLERYQDTNQRKAFNGKALLIVKSDGSGDPIRVTAHADGLTDGRATVFAQSTKGPRELLEVLSYPATTKVGQAPTLPETVTAVYSDGTTETLPVDWALPDPSDYAAVGQFTVSGTVLDGSIDVTLDVAVIGIVAVEKVSTATVVGTTPTLPGTANILYSNGAREAAEVAWDPTEPADYDTVGDIVLVGGTVVGTTLPASASVRVAATPTAVNIALAAVAPTGSPVASFTNSGDSLPAIRDGIIQLDRETGTKNSWSNWQSAVRRNDWLGIQWTDAMPVNKIVAHFTNGTDGCQDPTTVTWTPKYIGTDGVEHDATGVVQTTVAVSGTNAGGRPAYVLTFEFDQVLATRLTLALYNPGTNCVCMTEFQVPASILTLNTNAALSDLTVDGTTVDGFDPATTGYALTLPYNAGVPAVEGTGTDNAAVTVISPARLPGTARIMVTSENGRSSRTYTVAVEREIAPLASAALSTDSTALTEDDQAETALTVLDELAESISAEEYTVAYESDDPSVVRLAGSTLLAVGAGTANVKAVVTARGATVDSNSLPITVTPGADPKVFDHFANVVLKTAVGSPPSLPERVLAYYDHGLARELLVDWAVVPPTDYAAIGHFTVQGTVSGIAQPVLANVEAVGVIAVQAVRTATIVGERPTLPRSVNVYYSDKTDAPTEVVWPALTPTELTTPGTYTLTGATAIGGVAPTAQIRVTDNYLNNGGLDVSVAKYGYNLPRITASYTWTDDSLAHISDDVVSFNDNPKNRWSNWTQTTAKRSGDWFEYVFGAEEETAYWLDEVTISWMHDSYARSAAAVTVQAWDADTETWYAVPGQVDEVVRS